MQHSFTLHCVPWQARASTLIDLRMAAYRLGLLSWAEVKANRADERSSHALVLSDTGAPIGCARVRADGKTERMAVLPVDNRTEIEDALRLAAKLIKKLPAQNKRKRSS